MQIRSAVDPNFRIQQKDRRHQMQANYSTENFFNKDNHTARDGRRTAYTSVGFVTKPQL
jgi:hypothetical protein